MDEPKPVRLTQAGRAHVTRLCRLYAYVDEMIVATRLADPAMVDLLCDVDAPEARRVRAELFLDYLDRAWAPLANAGARFDWPATRDAVRAEIARIRENTSHPSVRDKTAKA